MEERNKSVGLRICRGGTTGDDSDRDDPPNGEMNLSGMGSRMLTNRPSSMLSRKRTTSIMLHCTFAPHYPRNPWRLNLDRISTLFPFRGITITIETGHPHNCYFYPPLCLSSNRSMPRRFHSATHRYPDGLYSSAERPLSQFSTSPWLYHSGGANTSTTTSTIFLHENRLLEHQVLLVNSFILSAL